MGCRKCRQHFKRDANNIAHWPQVYAQLNRTSIHVTKVTLPGDGTAVVDYAIRVQGEDVAESDQANLHEGQWYLRTRDAPAVTVDRFRMLLGLEYETGPEVKLSPPVDGE